MSKPPGGTAPTTCSAPIGATHFAHFDAERFLRETVEQLSADELFAIARGAQQSGYPMMQWPSALRAALLETLLTPSRGPST